MSNELAIPNLRTKLTSLKEQFGAVVPATMANLLTPDRLTKVAISCISRTPKLQTCSEKSILRAVFESASLGLEPGGVLGEAYLVPFKGECQLVVGYRGLLTLARRAGIGNIMANVIYANDVFDIDFAVPWITHKPCLTGKRGKMVAVYSIAEIKKGERHLDFMTIDEIEAIRMTSPGRDAKPWRDHYEEMAKKTVIKRAAKYWPRSTELGTAIEIDNNNTGKPQEIVLDMPQELQLEEHKVDAADEVANQVEERASVFDEPPR